MFGLGWGEIILILIVAVFVLGPERIPVAVRWFSDTVKKLRGMAATAQSDLQKQIGPELDELRRQVADLQQMKEFQDLKSLRNVNPKRFIQQQVLGDEFKGGMTGFLGLGGKGSAADQANAAAGITSPETFDPDPQYAAAGAPAMDNVTDPMMDQVMNMAYPARRVTTSLRPGEPAPFDSDGT